MLSTALKDLAVEMELFIMSSTQTNAKSEDTPAEGIKNESVVRGARSIIDKCDIACVISRLTKVEMDNLSTLDIPEMPNQVTDVYKVRRGKYVNVRIWSKVDLGTCRKEDLFITDGNLNLLTDFEFLRADYEIENEDAISELLHSLNNDIENSTSLSKLSDSLEPDTTKGIDFDEIKEENFKKKGLFDI